MTGIPGQGLTYTRAIADVICERLENGETLTAICKDIGTPASTVVKWSNKNHDGFGERYARARELGWNVVADQVIDIADEETAPDMLGQQRNRIDARKWLLSKRLPKTFGDKLDVNQTHTYAGMTDEQLAAERAELDRRDALSNRPGEALSPLSD